MKKKVLSLIFATLLILSLFAGCTKSNDNPATTEAPEEVITTGEIGVVKDEEFGNVYLDLTIDEFNNLGFAFGDSVDIVFDNGKSYTDIPYYSGYFVDMDELLLCGYPGYPHVVIARNYGDSTWEEFEMTDSSKVTVTRNTAGKYLSVEESHVHPYSDNRDDFKSDEIFANFRVVKGGDLKEDYFYRSASPCDNHHNRAIFANKFTEENKINFVLNLSDDEDEYKALVADDDFASDYYNSLYEKGNVLLLGLDVKYRSEDFAKVLSEALLEMTKHDGPILLHCVEGKDRTGFACALLLALADASADEIIDDYMITYYNYYDVTKESNPTKYDSTVGIARDFIYFLCDAETTADVNTLDIKSGAENYLKMGGLTDNQIKEIEDYITK